MQRSMVFWALYATVIIEIFGPCISGKNTLFKLANYGTFGIAAQCKQISGLSIYAFFYNPDYYGLYLPGSYF
jgi:hypothetical protein